MIYAYYVKQKSMNLILLYEDEVSGFMVLLSQKDERSIHVRKILKLKSGDNLKVGIVNGKIYSSIIEWGEDNALRIRIDESSATDSLVAARIFDNLLKFPHEETSSSKFHTIYIKQSSV